MDATVVIDQIPAVPEAKLPKLEGVLRKIFANLTTNLVFHFPRDEGAATYKDYCFVRFEDDKTAETAIKIADNYPLDKKHTLRLNKLADIEKYALMQDEYQEPEIEPFKERDYQRNWLADPRGRDQFVTVHAEQVSVQWNNRHLVPDEDHSRKNWSESYVQWSPLGSYLCTFHKQGLALWVSKTYEKFVRFPHPNVKLINFSPDEAYVTTYSLDTFEENGKPYNLSVWDVSSGRKLRSFMVDSAAVSSGSNVPWPVLNTTMPWPLFKYSPSSKYIARLGAGSISIYELPGMSLLDKKTIKADGVAEFSWSPTKDILAYWTPESGTIPARVTLMSIPSREVVRNKNLFGVESVSMYWQPNGDYLLCHVISPKAKKFTNSFEIFRFAERDVPIDVYEYPKTVSSLAWEPSGKKFAVIASDNGKNTLDVFEMIQEKNSPTAVKPIFSAEKKSGMNTISWSPIGRFLVLAGLKTTGDLEFYDTNDMSIMSSSEHYMCTDLDWDTSGRFLASVVSFWKHSSDTGYTIWSFTGQKLYTSSIVVFKQFLWRPRPPTLLSEEKQKETKKSYKKFASTFEQEDTLSETKASKDVENKRREEFAAWKALEAKWKETYEAKQSERLSLWGFDPSQKMAEFFEVVEEEEIVVE